MMCLVLFALALIGLLFSITAQYFAAKSAVGAASAMRSRLFSHILSFGYREMDDIGSSTLITRMTSDINQVQNGINMVLRLFLRSPFIVFGAMIMAFTLDAAAARIFLLVIILLFAVVFAIMLVSIPLYKKVQARTDTLLGRTRENLTGIRVLRAFCKEDAQIAAFKSENRALVGFQKFVGKISALMNPLTLVLVNLAVLQLIRTGAVRVDAGLMTQGTVVALYNYMSQILVELIKLANLIITVTKSFASAARIRDVLELDTNTVYADDKKIYNTHAVEFDCVSMHYNKGAKDALENISFTAEPGEIIGVIGGTGSGKTTLVGLIPRFYDASSGTIRVDGRNVNSYSLEELREKVHVVLQRAVLFRGTLRENLLWGNKNANDEEMQAAVKAAQAADFVQSKGGLDMKITAEGRNLSGGQRQRLSIARALVGNPEILILDDSASALDYVTEKALRSALSALPNKPTVFIVSQRTSSLRHADKILVLDNGALVGCGTHDALLENCSVYREIYDSQFGGKEAAAK